MSCHIFPKQLVNLTSHNLANIQLEIPLVSDPQNGSIGMLKHPRFHSYYWCPDNGTIYCALF